jgi:hypothetical protein
VRNIHRAIISLSIEFVLLGYIVEVFQFIKAKVLRALGEPNVQFAIFLVDFFEEIFESVLIADGSFFFEFILKPTVESI